MVLLFSATFMMLLFSATFMMLLFSATFMMLLLAPRSCCWVHRRSGTVVCFDWRC